MNIKADVRSQGQIERYMRAIVMLAAIVAITSLTSGCRSSAAASKPNAQANASTASKSASDAAQIVLPVAEQQGAIATTTPFTGADAGVFSFDANFDSGFDGGDGGDAAQ